MIFKAGLLAIELTMVFMQTAVACSPNQNMDIEFQKDKSELTGTEIEKLATFSIHIQQKYPNHDILEISGLAGQEERTPNALAKQRAWVVQQYFWRTQYRRAPVKLKSLVIQNRQRHLIGNPYRTEIMLVPKPPHGCSSGAFAESF